MGSRIATRGNKRNDDSQLEFFRATFTGFETVTLTPLVTPIARAITPNTELVPEENGAARNRWNGDALPPNGRASVPIDPAVDLESARMPAVPEPLVQVEPEPERNANKQRNPGELPQASSNVTSQRR